MFTNKNHKVSLLIIALFFFFSFVTTSTYALLDKDVLVSIYQQYDFDDEADETDELSCQNEDMNVQHLCPKDEKIPCSDIKEITKFCQDNIGVDITKSMMDVPINEGKNAIEGCVKYVGYHIMDLDHWACCPSAHCDEWLNDILSEMSLFNDEDGNDDDDYYNDDDDSQSQGELQILQTTVYGLVLLWIQIKNQIIWN